MAVEPGGSPVAHSRTAAAGDLPRRGCRCRPGPSSPRARGSAPRPRRLRLTLSRGCHHSRPELYFSRRSHAAIGRRRAVTISTLVYTLRRLPQAYPLLVLAAALLGVVTGRQRRVTGRILGPAVTHLTWSLGMLFLLPVVLDAQAGSGFRPASCGSRTAATRGVAWMRSGKKVKVSVYGCIREGPDHEGLISTPFVDDLIPTKGPHLMRRATTAVTAAAAVSACESTTTPQRTCPER